MAIIKQLENTNYHKISFFYVSENENNLRMTVESYANKESRLNGEYPLDIQTIELERKDFNTECFENIFYLNDKTFEIKTNENKKVFVESVFMDEVYKLLKAQEKYIGSMDDI